MLLWSRECERRRIGRRSVPMRGRRGNPKRPSRQSNERREQPRLNSHSHGEVLEPRTVAVFIRCEEREPSYAEAVGKARGQISLEELNIEDTKRR